MRPVLKASVLLAALAAPGTMLLPASYAQAAQQSAMLADHSMSTARLRGMTVYNDHNQPWGVIEDVLIRPGGEPMAVVNVGKMGGHDKMVLVPLGRLTVTSDHAMMRDATKEMAEKLPPFVYMAGGGG